MDINKELIDCLFVKANESESRRAQFDLRTSLDDAGQRMLNVMLPGSEVAIHRHPKSSENVILLSGKLEDVLYEEIIGEPKEGDEIIVTESGKKMKVSERHLLDASTGNFGFIVPRGAWHRVQVLEPSCIYHAKDGKAGEDGTEWL